VAVASAGGVVVGFVATHIVPRTDDDDWTCSITDIVVAAAHRRAGLGSALVAAAEQARSAGAPRLDLSSGDRRPDARVLRTDGLASRPRAFTERLSPEA